MSVRVQKNMQRVAVAPAHCKADARTVCKLRPKVILSENLNNPDKVGPDVIGPDCPAELDGRENVKRIPNVGARLVEVHQSVHNALGVAELLQGRLPVRVHIGN